VDLALNRASSADTSFAAMMDSPFESPELAVRVASRVRDLGRPVLAAEMMKRLESTYGGDAFFWFTLCIAAHEARDIETASRAAAKAYALEPANDVYAHNHAASLITLEQEPEEAVKLTMRLLAAAPRVVDRRINHALALINNRRYYDAEAALAGIDPETLSPEQATEFGFAKFLLLSAAGRADEARRAASRIDRTRLHAVQSERMRRVLEALPK
jgi:Flp pilus assembly protein TadD